MKLFEELKDKLEALDKEASDWTAEQAAQYKSWEEDQKVKLECAEESISNYFDGLNDKAQQEWSSVKKKWDAELVDFQSKSEAFIAKLEKMTANERAHASRAYAGMMTKFAIAAQLEADKAIGHAVRDRVKAFLT